MSCYMIMAVEALLILYLLGVVVHLHDRVRELLGEVQNSRESKPTSSV